MRPTRASSTRDSSAGSLLTKVVGFSADGSNSGIGLLSAKQRAKQNTRATPIHERRIMASAVIIVVVVQHSPRVQVNAPLILLIVPLFLEIESSRRKGRACGSKRMNKSQ